MKARMTTRYLAKHEGQRGTWFGTCPVWARDARANGLAVTNQRVLVVNPTHEACPVPTCPVGSHIRVPAPTTNA